MKTKKKQSKEEIIGEWRIVLQVGTIGEAEPNIIGLNKQKFLADELLREHIEKILKQHPYLGGTLRITLAKVDDMEQTNW